MLILFFFLVYLSESSPRGTSVAFVSVKDADYGSNGEVKVEIVTKTSEGEAKNVQELTEFCVEGPCK